MSPECLSWHIPSVLQSHSQRTTSRSWGKPQKSEGSSLAVASTALVRESWRDHTSGIPVGIIFLAEPGTYS